MGSRIRENVTHLFQCFCEVVQPQPPDKEPWIIQKFPELYKDEEILKSVPKFAYPCEFVNTDNTVIQHYSFVLTNIDSKWTFGFCRHDPKTETALVLLSYLPWHKSFYKLLDIIGEMVISSKSGAEQLWTFLDAVYNSIVPEQGGSLQVPYNHGLSNFICHAPNQLLLPSIPENHNLNEYYSAVGCMNMMVIFASMLYERRIVFISTRLHKLSACVQAANAIIYPMNWQHIFIPVLPHSLIDYLLAPMPFLIGVPTSTFKKVRRSDMGEVVVLDADADVLETPFNDLESIPVDVVNSLKRELRNQVSVGDGVSRAFLRALVQLIGGYRDALKFHQGERITFNSDAFVESRPTSMQPFLRKMLQLQIFQQFIEERLDMLNAGLGFSDEFEIEACNYSDKTSGKLRQQYKEWLSTVKKEGSAFFKSVKSKANPAMKSAVKSVKDRGKDVRTAYKGIRSKFRELQPPSKEYSGNTEKAVSISKDRPNSAPNSPPQRRRPATLAPFIKLSPTSAVTYRKDPTLSGRKLSMQEQRSHYSTLSPGEASCGSASPPECGTPGLKLSPIDTDLMGDLHDVIFQKCSSLMDDQREDPVPPVDRTVAQSPNDLIRLDSTPSFEEFDPLVSTNPPAASSSNFGPTNINNSNNNIMHKLKETSLSNPLYPYYTPQGYNSTQGNTSFLYPNNVIMPVGRNAAAVPAIQPSSSSNINQHSRNEAQDSQLLREYGIEFKSWGHNGTGGQTLPSNGALVKPVVTDPFEDVERLANGTQQHQLNTNQRMWTKFD
ncbi:DENN domain-containing protein 1A-like isoform X3 [Thrips palmi]|uniref:DENN domain-containing protein 1A-like isoform X3 n=1 Tax=Thrips palmi TaxID=161013 RepID=A0A6P9ACT3_THRPL|nr:DENN domain-containing protein 1A-like isoform X3 [Thrips palmi]